jgi:hypothetical protein
VCQALVQSILLYGAETWTLNTQQANKLLATEKVFWRRCARKSRKEKSEMSPFATKNFGMGTRGNAKTGKTQRKMDR